MRDYPVNHEKLHEFSMGLPYGLSKSDSTFLNTLNEHKNHLNFPAITNDVGSLLRFILANRQVNKIFEFGSGYGHSLFWYKNLADVEKIVLTEKRDDLEALFHSLNWDQNLKLKIEYYQGDAFERFKMDDEIYDFILIDGVKASYQDFLKLCLTRISNTGFIAIDNSYWRGSFLDEKMQFKKSAKAIADLHEYINSLEQFECTFIPFIDGLSLIQRKSL